MMASFSSGWKSYLNSVPASSNLAVLLSWAKRPPLVTSELSREEERDAFCRALCTGLVLELQTHVREDFPITEKSFNSVLKYEYASVHFQPTLF